MGVGTQLEFCQSGGRAFVRSVEVPPLLVVLCISVYRDLLGPTFPPLDPLNPSVEKEEPRGQRPSSQACQLGLKLLRGQVGAAPSPASWAPAFFGHQRGCPSEEPQEAAGVGGRRFIWAGSLVGVHWQAAGSLVGVHWRAAGPGLPEVAELHWAPVRRPAA